MLISLSVISEDGAWMHVGIKIAVKVSSQVFGEIFFFGYEPDSKMDHGINSRYIKGM